MQTINVLVPESPARSYPVVIGSGLLKDCWSQIEEQFPKAKKIVVTDKNVSDAGLVRNLLAGSDLPVFMIDPPGEISKNFNTIIAILETMEAAAMGRDSVIVAIGGGTVGDMAGFAASIFKRGVPVVHIPTTTVSQADSSIGGKTGIDSTVSKNAFGTFWNPKAVYIDVQTLETLDQRQYNAGLVESLKHALICDSEYFEFFESNISSLINRDDSVLIHLAVQNANIKASVVQNDPTEKNQRRILNYGHTIGHAIESISGYELLHGECVGIGILAASLIEIELGIGSLSRFERIESVLRKLSLPTKIPQCQTCQEILELLKRDKKAVDAWPRFALIQDIGQPYCANGQWAHLVSGEIVTKVVSAMRL